jgi:membrane fusion protein (multidrug efflux system)
LLGLVAVSLGCGQGDQVEASTDDTRGNTQAVAESAGDDDEGDEAIDPDAAKTEDDEDDEDDEDKEEPVPIEVAQLERGGIESVLRFSSNLEAEDEVQVVSQAKRLVRELLVEEGDIVRKDQVLLRLQDDEQRSQLSKVKSQFAKAERDYERQKKLFEQELISDQVFSEAMFEYEQLQISVEDAERELGYTEVRASISGTVTQRLAKVGDQVQIGQHLFDIVDFESMVARIFVPEKHLLQLRSGLVARLSTSSGPGVEFVARVERVSPIVDPKSGTVKVTIAVGAQRGLRPGLYVDVDLVTATHEEALLVPKRAVVYDSDQMFVYRLGEERRVERIYVEPLLADKHFVEPREGLEVGDEIVVAGQAGLKHGALVSLPGDEDPDAEELDEGIMETAQVTR